MPLVVNCLCVHKYILSFQSLQPHFTRFYTIVFLDRCFPSSTCTYCFPSLMCRALIYQVVVSIAGIFTTKKGGVLHCFMFACLFLSTHVFFFYTTLLPPIMPQQPIEHEPPKRQHRQRIENEISIGIRQSPPCRGTQCINRIQLSPQCITPQCQ